MVRSQIIQMGLAGILETERLSFKLVLQFQLLLGKHIGVRTALQQLSGYRDFTIRRRQHVSDLSIRKRRLDKAYKRPAAVIGPDQHLRPPVVFELIRLRPIRGNG
ncbi:MAG: hypothetical protein JO273_22325 [Methylobacteriaceae bacterium]|nr:hypothetical protein [Methylobacteriaceae bacterium]